MEVFSYSILPTSKISMLWLHLQGTMLVLISIIELIQTFWNWTLSAMEGVWICDYNEWHTTALLSDVLFFYFIFLFPILAIGIKSSCITCPHWSSCKCVLPSPNDNILLDIVLGNHSGLFNYFVISCLSIVHRRWSYTNKQAGWVLPSKTTCYVLQLCHCKLGGPMPQNPGSC